MEHLYVITGHCRRTGEPMQLSTRCNLKDIVKYLESEYLLAKRHPKLKGLYYEFHRIRVEYRGWRLT